MSLKQCDVVQGHRVFTLADKRLRFSEHYRQVRSILAILFRIETFLTRDGYTGLCLVAVRESSPPLKIVLGPQGMAQDICSRYACDKYKSILSAFPVSIYAFAH